MRKLEIISIGKTREKWLQEALLEYEKRLKPKLQIDWKIVSNFAKVEPPYIALDVQGELVNSVKLSHKLISLFDQCGSRLSFLIGGSEGIEREILDKSIWRWSLSPLTFTHQMTRLIVLEQLYRSFEIDAGSKYHK